MKKTISLQFLVLFACASASFAQGSYFGVFGGVASADDIDTASSGLGASLETDSGMVIGASFGKSTTPNINSGVYSRYELELAYRSNDVEGVGIGGLGSVAGTDVADALGVSGFGGDFSALSLHANYIVGLPLASRISAYAGIGAGISKLDASVDLGSFSEEGTVSASFSYQLMGGLEWALSPQMSAYGEFRYMGTASDLTFDALDAAGVETGAASALEPLSYKSTGFLFGLRFYF